MEINGNQWKSSVFQAERSELELGSTTSSFTQVVYVLLVTAVGTSLWDRFRELVEEPTKILRLLAQTLPAASHFYLNYVPLQRLRLKGRRAVGRLTGGARTA